MTHTHAKGFTLIEVVVALAIFAIIASITSYVLFQSFATDERLKAQSARLREVEFALTWLRRDTEQLVERPVRSEQQKLISAFVGQEHYLEFTRNGYINPGEVEQRSTLKRVAYLCQGSTLIRRSWTLLDTLNRKQYHDTVLLHKLQQCSFSYTNNRHQTLSNWVVPNTNVDKKHPSPKIPTTLIGHFLLADWGAVTLTLPITVGLYA